MQISIIWLEEEFRGVTLSGILGEGNTRILEYLFSTILLGQIGDFWKYLNKLTYLERNLIKLLRQALVHTPRVHLKYWTILGRFAITQ